MRQHHLFILTLFAVLAVSTISYGALTDGLVAYYPFNGNANDESGHGNNGIVPPSGPIGTPSQGATLTQDIFGNPDSAYNFTGYYNLYS
ncbi:MAG: hypothetical protein WCG27_13010 [Pseudomonadota bacterium]